MVHAGQTFVLHFLRGLAAASTVNFERQTLFGAWYLLRVFSYPCEVLFYCSFQCVQLFFLHTVNFKYCFNHSSWHHYIYRQFTWKRSNSRSRMIKITWWVVGSNFNKVAQKKQLLVTKSIYNSAWCIWEILFIMCFNGMLCLPLHCSCYWHNTNA